MRPLFKVSQRQVLFSLVTYSGTISAVFAFNILFGLGQLTREKSFVSVGIKFRAQGALWNLKSRKMQHQKQIVTFSF